jgi:drug/metabolite transporter (DMT)-like permease
MRSNNNELNIATRLYLALATGISVLSFSAMFVRWADAPWPITGLYPVFLAIPLLGEIPTFLQLVGSAIALAGIYLVNLTHNRSNQLPNKL